MVDPKSSNISPVATILTEQIWFKFFRCFPAKIRAMLYPNPKFKKKKPSQSYLCMKYILLNVLVSSIADYFYELYRILTSP